MITLLLKALQWLPITVKPGLSLSLKHSFLLFPSSKFLGCTMHLSDLCTRCPSWNATQPSCPQANLTFHHLTPQRKAPTVLPAWASAAFPHSTPTLMSPIILSGGQGVDIQVP